MEKTFEDIAAGLTSSKCPMLRFLSVFLDLLRLTTTSLPYCKGQVRANGKPYLCFESSLPDILSFCPLVLVGTLSQQCLFIRTY